MKTNIKKRFLGLLLSLAMVLTSLPITGFAEEQSSEDTTSAIVSDEAVTTQADNTVISSGTCGKNLTWKLNNTGILTISGTGAMDNWDNFENESLKVPWDSECSQITSVVIKNGVTSIGGAAFGMCENLTNVTIPDSVTSIGNGAFSGCENLISIIIPDGVTTIGRGIFQACENLTSVTIPDSVTSISENAFAYCYNLSNVKLPNSITNIGKKAFEYCYSLSNINLPNKISSIGEGAFTGCSGLTSIVLPNHLTSISHGTFVYCDGLTDVTISGSVTHIDDWAFADCIKLTTIHFLGHAPSSIGSNCFFNVKAMSYYPKGDSTWTADKKQNYGGKITWASWNTSNSITASNVTKYASATKAQTFSLDAKAKGGKLSYKSDNSKITVNSKGQVTIAKNYTGTAKITITAGSNTYATVTKTITVTVKPIDNTITASNFTKTCSTKNQTFSIGAKRSGSGKITYTSSSKSVAVSSTGKVTVKANYIGKATITIKVAASGIYKAASKKITVTVLPTKTTLSGVSNVKGLKMTVKWKKNAVGTGYQLQYSTDKNFKTGVKTVTVKKNSTVSTTISKLTKGKTYYVRIRTYKAVSAKNYYSGWSTAKSVKITK